MLLSNFEVIQTYYFIGPVDTSWEAHEPVLTTGLWYKKGLKAQGLTNT